MKISRIVVLSAFLTIFGLNLANAQDLGSLFGNGVGSTLGNMIEGVFTSSNITVEDMEGEWSSTGPAVVFQSEDMLKKAGGLAAAGALENKLAPYYSKYGLDGAVMTVNPDGTFTLKTSKLNLKGTISEGSKRGMFNFSFTALGVKLITLPAYVQKTSTTMDVMFDATKFKKFISAIGNLTGIKIAKTFAGMLDSYDGLCIGFHFKGGPKDKNTSTGAEMLGKGIDLLRNTLGRGK